MVQDPHVNVVPVFDGDKCDVRVRAHDLGDESLKEKYTMPLEDDRKAEGSLAVVLSLTAFKKNFDILSESYLGRFRLEKRRGGWLGCFHSALAGPTCWRDYPRNQTGTSTLISVVKSVAELTIDMYGRNQWGSKVHGNFKDKDPEDVAELDFEDDMSNYHSFAIPYGPRFTAQKIEKLLFTKDMLLNAEWNVEPDRAVNLHRRG
ncbi:MAG: hypothetical protein LQ340_004947 [Diploschistes diacapsis]|nr:MAG: hypothetical protein LQ340_004947 [Diploschistes diacapsis]